MVGFTGGLFGDQHLTEVLEPLRHEEWYDCERASEKVAAVGVLSHNPDSAHCVVSEGGTVGFVYGDPYPDHAVENLVEGLLANPTKAAQTVDGPFVAAAGAPDERRVVLVTDRIGCFPC